MQNKLEISELKIWWYMRRDGDERQIVIMII